MATDPRYTKSAREGGIPRPQTFGEAFREAKDAGKPDFEFPPRSGKMYSTKTAEEQGREIGATARGSGRSASAGRTAADRDTATTRRAEIPTKSDAKAPTETGGQMSPLEMGLLTTAGALGGPLAGRAAVRAYPTVRAAALKAGEMVSEGVRSAKSAIDAAKAARAGRAAEAAKTAERVEPKMDLEPVAQPFRSARAKAEREELLRARDSLKESLKSKESPKPQFRSRTADRMDEREMGMKKGGKVKAYAKGGSVRGGGCESRTKKTKYV